MYLKHVIYENIGPLKTINLNLPFNDNGDPKPIILVGENGSGKSTVLSTIVDAFYEMAGQEYSNAQKKEEDSIGSQYYKTISKNEIHTGEPYMFSYLVFKGENEYKYALKSGTVSSDILENKYTIKKGFLHWNENENSKNISISKEDAAKEWRNNVICYFGPERYEKPSWMGDKYYNLDDYAHPSVKQRWEGKLSNDISIKSTTATTLQWLLDIIADSRADINSEQPTELKIEHVEVNNLILLRQARTNIETILSEIVGEQVYFSLNYRSDIGSRFKIIRKKDNTVYCPSLDSLSTGQSALFNIFATIVRYADENDINKSINLTEIQGIVAIDEIELHLHSNLQKETLPKLLKLFPKIQFIITSHSPLFLLGMRDTFNTNSFEVYEMPGANKIDIESFSEFQKAYEYLKQTDKFQKEMKNAIDQLPTTGEPLIITEGHTDWKHIKAAFNALKSNDKYNDLFSNLDFEIFEYGSSGSEEESVCKLEMGNKTLLSICECYSKLPHGRKYIFIFDRDDKKVNQKISQESNIYKNWGNNVFSIMLPIPDNRKATPEICIEHYYSDEEIKFEWKNPNDNINRRLFIGNEFDHNGIHLNNEYVCGRKDLCGKGSIAIIDGTSGNKVSRIMDHDSNTNFALSKSAFANFVLKKEPPFDKITFENFVPLFQIINTIIQL